MELKKRKKRRETWRALRLEEKVEILYLLVYSPMKRSEICERVKRSPACVSYVKREYCDVTETVTLKAKKTHMAQLLRARSEAEDETRG